MTYIHRSARSSAKYQFRQNSESFSSTWVCTWDKCWKDSKNDEIGVAYHMFIIGSYIHYICCFNDCGSFVYTTIYKLLWLIVLHKHNSRVYYSCLWHTWMFSMFSTSVRFGRYWRLFLCDFRNNSNTLTCSFPFTNLSAIKLDNFEAFEHPPGITFSRVSWPSVSGRSGNKLNLT